MAQVRKKAIHWNGDEHIIAKHTPITREWTLLDAMSDANARWEAPGGKPVHHLKELFLPGLGPNRNSLDKKGTQLNNMAQQVKEQFAKQRDQLLALCSAPVIQITDKKHEARCEALRLAREARKAKAPKAVRRISFMGSSPKKALTAPIEEKV
jgi:hypothetical protein